MIDLIKRLTPKWEPDDIRWLMMVVVFVGTLAWLTSDTKDTKKQQVHEQVLVIETETFMMLANDGLMYEYTWETLAKALMAEKKTTNTQTDSLTKQQQTLNEDKMYIASQYELKLDSQKQYYEQVVLDLKSMIERLEGDKQDLRTEHESLMKTTTTEADRKLVELRLQFEQVLKTIQHK